MAVTHEELRILGFQPRDKKSKTNWWRKIVDSAGQETELTIYRWTYRSSYWTLTVRHSGESTHVTKAEDVLKYIAIWFHARGVTEARNKIHDALNLTNLIDKRIAERVTEPYP